MGVKELTLVFVAIVAAIAISKVADAKAGAAWLTAFAALYVIWYGGKIYKAQSGNKAYLSITLEAEVGERYDGSAWVLVNAVLHNPSKVPCNPPEYRWKIEDVSKGETPVLVECEVVPVEGDITLEPGETLPVEIFSRAVDKNVKVLLVDFTIPSIRKDGQCREWGKSGLVVRRVT